MVIFARKKARTLLLVKYHFNCQLQGNSVVSSVALLTNKPIIYAANVSDSDFSQGIENNEYYKKVKAIADSENAAVLLTHYSDDDSTAEETVRIEFRNANNSKPIKVEYFLLDAEHKCELMREEIFTASEFASYLKMPLFSTYLLKITQIQ